MDIDNGELTPIITVTKNAISDSLLKDFLLAYRHKNLEKADDFSPEHHVLALYIYHKIVLAYKYWRAFLVAGTDDLAALLPLLDLDKPGNEALVCVVPYIHAEVLYFKNIKGVLHCFVIDSQNWGGRYYPNRNIVKVIRRHFPKAVIQFANTDLQLQENNQSCYVFAIKNMREIIKMGQEITDVFKCETTEDTFRDHLPAPIKLMARDQLPTRMLRFKEKGGEFSKLRTMQKRTKYRDKDLRDILKGYVTDQGEIDWGAIHDVRLRLSGFQLLPEALSPSARPLYDIKINSSKNGYEVVLQFTDKDHFKYSNLVTYSPAIFPMDVSKENTRILFADLPGVTAIIDEKNFSVRYRIKDLKVFSDALENVDTLALYEQHMRQSLGLQVLTQEIREAITLHQIAHEGEQGLGFEAICGALVSRFVENDSVYVCDGHYCEETQDVQIRLQLENIVGKEEIETILIPFSIDKSHCILVTIYPKKKIVVIHDPENELESLNLRNILPEEFSSFEDLMTQGHYSQKAEWECGLLVFLEAEATVKKAGNWRKVLTEGERKKELRRCWRHYEEYATDRVEVEKMLTQNRLQKDRLLQAVETVRCEDAQGKLKSLADALQIELWGNLDRNPDDVHKNSGRAQEQVDAIRNRSLTEFCDAYNVAYPDDHFGLYVLNNLPSVELVTEDELIQWVNDVLAEEILRPTSEDEPKISQNLVLAEDIFSLKNTRKVDTLQELRGYFGFELKGFSTLNELPTVEELVELLDGSSAMKKKYRLGQPERWSAVMGMCRRMILEKRVRLLTLAQDTEKQSDETRKQESVRRMASKYDCSKIIEDRRQRITQKYPELPKKLVNTLAAGQHFVAYVRMEHYCDSLGVDFIKQPVLNMEAAFTLLREFDIYDPKLDDANREAVQLICHNVFDITVFFEIMRMNVGSVGIQELLRNHSDIIICLFTDVRHVLTLVKMNPDAASLLILHNKLIRCFEDLLALAKINTELAENVLRSLTFNDMQGFFSEASEVLTLAKIDFHLASVVFTCCRPGMIFGLFQKSDVKELFQAFPEYAPILMESTGGRIVSQLYIKDVHDFKSLLSLNDIHESILAVFVSHQLDVVMKKYVTTIDDLLTLGKTNAEACMKIIRLRSYETLALFKTADEFLEFAKQTSEMATILMGRAGERVAELFTDVNQVTKLHRINPKLAELLEIKFKKVPAHPLASTLFFFTKPKNQRINESSRGQREMPNFI